MIRQIEKSLTMKFLSRTSPNKDIKTFFRQNKTVGRDYIKDLF